MSYSSVPSAAGTLREKKCGGQVGKEAWRHEGMAKPPCVGCVLNPLVDGQANAVSTGSRQKLRCEISGTPRPPPKIMGLFQAIHNDNRNSGICSYFQRQLKVNTPRSNFFLF